MITINHTFYLDHGLQDSFNFINNAKNETDWSSSIIQVDELPENRIKLRYNFLGKKEDFILQITTDSFRTRTFESIEGAFPIRGSQTFTPSEDGTKTQVEWFFEMNPGKYFGIIPIIIIKKATEKVMKKDAETLNKLMTDKLVLQK
ncbi:hypothetical protein [Aquimarina sp. 2201CG5-10]|uniref:hypothetical protein n=1 Tax=Aquimarina callyspongiae TaxID=3098150 RepID=UPI002AB5D176|nr:hypothetical protein [Aquimarina sp. 2201CG5-10]MDY8138353.1 hypothetical protein [Aquimarina sp. 2201CG5-10]